jgi:hypothetical protein
MHAANSAMARALSAAPPKIAKAAKVVDLDDKGNEMVLREGINRFTCYPEHPGVVGGQAYCANEAAMQWQRDFAAHKRKPTNTEPGIECICWAEQIGAAVIPTLLLGRPSKNLFIG